MFPPTARARSGTSMPRGACSARASRSTSPSSNYLCMGVDSQRTRWGTSTSSATATGIDVYHLLIQADGNQQQQRVAQINSSITQSQDRKRNVYVYVFNIAIVKNHPPQKKDSDNDQDATKERRKRATVDTSHRVYKQVQRTNGLGKEPPTLLPNSNARIPS